MAIYDVSGGEMTSVDNAAKLKLYPWPVILDAADLTTSAAGAGVLQGDVLRCRAARVCTPRSECR